MNTTKTTKQPIRNKKINKTKTLLWTSDRPDAETYSVRLLSFMTGIIKSICVEEMTLLLLFFTL